MRQQSLVGGHQKGSTRALAELVSSLCFEDIPDEVVNRAIESALDFFGVAIGAAWHPSVGKMVKLSATLGSPRQASLIGRREKCDALWAALINGSMAHILDFDDTHFPTILHGYTPILAACLALSEALPSMTVAKVSWGISPSEVSYFENALATTAFCLGVPLPLPFA